MSDVTIRRSVISDSYATTAHSQGLYASEMTGLTLDQDVFDHDGWNATVPGAGVNGYSHDIYCYADATGLTVTDSIVADAAFVGILARGGGTIDDNLIPEQRPGHRVRQRQRRHEHGRRRPRADRRQRSSSATTAWARPPSAQAIDIGQHGQGGRRHRQRQRHRRRHRERPGRHRRRRRHRHQEPRRLRRRQRPDDRRQRRLRLAPVPGGLRPDRRRHRHQLSERPDRHRQRVSGLAQLPDLAPERLLGHGRIVVRQQLLHADRRLVQADLGRHVRRPVAAGGRQDRLRRPPDLRRPHPLGGDVRRVGRPALRRRPVGRRRRPCRTSTGT